MNFILNTIIILFLLSLNNLIYSDSLKVSQKIWGLLSIEEQDIVTDKNTVEIYDSNRYGKIIDVQSVNESYYNNGSGSRLGSALGQASYLDRANWGNYSAKTQIGAAIVGGLVGSMLDKPYSSGKRA